MLYRSSSTCSTNVRRAEPGERRRERQHGDEQRAAVGERLELLVVGREQHRRGRRIDDGERMRPERDQHGREARRRRALVQMPKDVAVAEMHAVERADGDDRSAGELRKARAVSSSRSTSAGLQLIRRAIGDRNESFVMIEQRDA